MPATRRPFHFGDRSANGFTLGDPELTGSTSSVMGYYIYRGTQTGGPYAKLNATRCRLTHLHRQFGSSWPDLLYVVQPWTRATSRAATQTKHPPRFPSSPEDIGVRVLWRQPRAAYSMGWTAARIGSVVALSLPLGSTAATCRKSVTSLDCSVLVVSFFRRQTHSVS